MSSKLIAKNQYHKFVKMSYSEVSHFLEEGEYKTQIDDLAVRHKGADLIEFALNANASQCFKKVISISKGDTKLLIQNYLLRLDINNLKTILRGINSDIPEDQINMTLMSGCNIKKKKLLQLFNKGKIEEIIEDPIIKKIFPDMDLSSLKSKELNLVNIENWLDYSYYRLLINLADHLPNHASEFKRFLRLEIDMLNINTLLVMKQEGLEKKDIMPLLITPAADISLSVLESVASAKDIESALDILIKHKLYSKEINTGKNQAIEGTLSVIHRELDKRLMKKAFLLLHQHPLSIAPILGYILAKEVEIRNLKLVSRSKSLNLPEKFIEENIILA